MKAGFFLLIATLTSSYVFGQSSSYSFVFLNKKADAVQLPKEEGDKLMAGHMANIERLAKEGKLIAAGPFEGGGGIFIFNTLLIDVLERWKLNPPPDLTHPDIIEWSKPLPPEQWARRSPELEQAIVKREAELAAQARDKA